MSLSCGPVPNALNCYRNFGDDDADLNDDVPTSASTGNEYDLVAQMDLMFQPDHPPVEIEGIMTFPLNPNVPPAPIAGSVEPSEWSTFATCVMEQSNRFLHHRSKELAFLYFGVLVLFLIILTAIKYYMDTSLAEAIGIGTCLVAILAFVVAFNRLPVWHDASLDDAILTLTSRQPLRHYYLTYMRYNPSEGFMGVTRRIRIYRKNTATYQQPNLHGVPLTK